jgi:hypothetical protein
LTSDPPTELPLEEQADYCAQPWCYVNALSCSTVTSPQPSTFFNGLRYSYETCGASDFWTGSNRYDARSGYIGIITELLTDKVQSFTEKPVEWLAFVVPVFEREALALSGSGFQLSLENFLYAQIQESVDIDKSYLEMIYVGLESGLFTGYYSETSYTVRAATGSAGDIPWAPYTLANVATNINTACSTCASVSSREVSAGASCLPSTAGLSGTCQGAPWMETRTACEESVGTCDSADPDISGMTTKVLCDTAATPGTFTSTATYDPTIDARSCNANGCCDANIRAYYSTSRALLGRPGALTSWKIYDARERSWYTSTKEKWLTSSQSTSTKLNFTPIYAFDTTGHLGVTAAAALVVNGIFQGVYALDIQLSSIAAVLSETVDAKGVGRWAYLVERSGPAAGKLVASTAEAELYDMDSQTRLGAEASDRTAISESAIMLAARGWKPGFFQRLEEVASATTLYHECYMKLSYDDCRIPLDQQYTPWSSDNPAEKRAAGPASCIDGSRSCILESHDFGGSIGDCGYAPLIAIAVNNAGWLPPGWFDGPVTVHPSLQNAETCQDVCKNDGRCEFFSYEWEDFTSFEFMSKILPGPIGTLDWLLVTGQDIKCESTADIWDDGRCATCASGMLPNAQMDKCVPCEEGTAGLDGECQACPAGTIPNSRATKCELCEAAKTSLAGTSVCFDCPVGRHGSAGGCELCLEGFFSMSVNELDLSPTQPCESCAGIALPADLTRLDVPAPNLESPSLCKGGIPGVTAVICPVQGLWFHFPRGGGEVVPLTCEHSESCIGVVPTSYDGDCVSWLVEEGTGFASVCTGRGSESSDSNF